MNSPYIGALALQILKRKKSSRRLRKISEACTTPDTQKGLHENSRTVLSTNHVWSLFVLVSGLALFSFAGCGSGVHASSLATSLVLSGSLHGGLQPISQAQIELYAMGTTGDASASTSLLSTTAHTDTSGAFKLTGQYTCPSSNSWVYVVATDGVATVGNQKANSAISLMALVGQCGSLSSLPSVQVNEITTVAAIAELAPFMRSVKEIGSGSQDAELLNQAVQAAMQLANPATGLSPGLDVPTGQVVPSDKLNSLADILVTCVNSSGGIAGDGSACGRLFSLAASGNVSVPADTASATLLIAENPTQNVSNIFQLLPSEPAFLPVLKVTPPDWRISLFAIPGAPVITPSGGTLQVGQTVSIADATSGTQIYYTVDGTVPSASSPVYTGPITLSASGKINAVAVKNAIASSVATAVFNLYVPISVALTPSSATLNASQSQSLTAVVTGSSNGAVTWSLNPAVGSISSTGVYTAPATVPISKTVTVTATSAADPTKNASASLSLMVPAEPAQTMGPVQVIGSVAAAQAVAGLGFNIDPSSEWEYKMAAAAGATHVRFQCGWEGIETQTAPPLDQNTSTQYVLFPGCASGITLAKKYGMHPTIIAAYGPPHHQIVTLVVPGGAPAGATTVNVQFASGVGGVGLSSLRAFYNTMISATGSQLSSRHSYPGTLVTDVHMIDATHATVTLASALTSALPANATSQYYINEYLYPPPATFSAADPSVIAYAKYAEFLAKSIAAAGLTGEVELWNEPTWADDPWDSRADFYDVFPGPSLPGPLAGNLPNFGFVAALQNRPSPGSGVTYVWAGTNGTGWNSVLDTAMFANTGVTLNQPASVITSESFHPYGSSPEGELWSDSCLKATINPYPAAPTAPWSCNLVSDSSSNALFAPQYTMAQQRVNPSWGVGHSITETGFGLVYGDATHQARFILRQFLGYEAAGVTPIEFYRLYDAGNNFTFFDGTTQNPLPSYTTISGLLSDLAIIGKTPVSPIVSSALSSITSYAGTIPLDLVHMVGSRSGDTANSEILALWQQSTAPNGQPWGALAQPAAAKVTITIPKGMAVSKLLNLMNRQAVAYTITGQVITLSVSDDPIEVLLVPQP